MGTFLSGLIKQPRKSTISMAVWTKRPRKWELFLAFRWNSQGEAQFPWRFDEEAKEMRTFLGVICKPPRQLQIFLAAYKICHEIIFSWLLTSTAKVTLYSLAVQSWPPRKSLAAKVIRFWCSDCTLNLFADLPSNVICESRGEGGRCELTWTRRLHHFYETTPAQRILSR